MGKGICGQLGGKVALECTYCWWYNLHIEKQRWKSKRFVGCIVVLGEENV